MKNNDIELIRLTLDGDDTAFAKLVEKYRSAVQALVWRKIGDFHIAEEITQDVFLKAYNELGSIKRPQSFASWLYVSASRRCLSWQRKKRLPMKSLEDTSNVQDEDSTYSQFVVDENQRVSEQAQRDVVNKLLAKLPESERTVITLHFFSEMSSFEIGDFLGVSANTIRSRLRRALQRLRKEEPIIREALEHFQMTPNLTGNILREVSRQKPAPSNTKPLIPWVVAASSTVLIILMLGIGSQFLAYFQKPYMLETQAESTIELVDSSLVLNLDTQQDKRKRVSNTKAIGKNDTNDQKPDDLLSEVGNDDGVSVPEPTPQWIPSTPIKGSPVINLHATPEGEIYALTDEIRAPIYKLSADSSEWQYLFDRSLPTTYAPFFPFAKWKKTLYILPYNELFASMDDGKTWDLIYTWKEQNEPKTILGTEHALYIAFGTRIFRTNDRGKSWKKMKEGLRGRIVEIFKFQNSLFTLTDIGLFRLNSDNWERIELPSPKVGRILSIAAAENNLYIAARVNFGEVGDGEDVNEGIKRSWWIFRSTNLGDSWKDITPKNAWSLKERSPKITLLATGKTLLAMERGMVRSTDSGDTWMQPTHKKMHFYSPAATHNNRVFYISSQDGLQRSTDYGETWDKVKILHEKKKRPIEDIIVNGENNEKQSAQQTLYVKFPNDVSIFPNGIGSFSGEIAETTDNGKSWQTITETISNINPSITHLVKSDGIIYAKGGTAFNVGGINIYRVSQDNKTLVPIKNIPVFDIRLLFNHYVLQIHNKPPMDCAFEHEMRVKEKSVGAAQFFKQLTEIDEKQPNATHAKREKHRLFQYGLLGPFAVSKDTFYMEYNFKLFRWRYGELEWHDTCLEEILEIDLSMPWKELKLAVSGDTVYVGKRDGHLIISFDQGNNWIDLTHALPFPVKTFKDIVVDGTKAYVATDAGVILTDDGRRWYSITDAAGTNLIMEHLAVDENVLYGVNKQTGIYRIENDVWIQVVANKPDKLTSLAVAGDTIYVGTEYNELLHYNLQKNIAD